MSRTLLVLTRMCSTYSQEKTLLATLQRSSKTSSSAKACRLSTKPMKIHRSHGATTKWSHTTFCKPAPRQSRADCKVRLAPLKKVHAKNQSPKSGRKASIITRSSPNGRPPSRQTAALSSSLWIKARLVNNQLVRWESSQKRRLTGSLRIW